MTSAGEVEQFVYCPHNWLLARRGVGGGGEASRHGVEEHRRLGKAQAGVERDKREYRRGLTWMFRVLGMAASATFLTLELVYLRALEHHLILLATALVLVGASAGLFLIAVISERRYRRGQRESGLVPGDLVASDLAGEGPLLVDPEWGLRGRPDSVLETRSGWVPVEFKTGTTPPRPHRNHALQLACYLRLIEAKTGKPPEYGLLNYPDGVFRVNWDDALRAELREALSRIAEAKRTLIADRDHQHAARCAGCARRDACDQRLA